MHVIAAETLLAARRVPEALKEFEAAARAGVDPLGCAAARWTCYMLLGNFEGAWRESDFIAASAAEDPNRVWDGRPLTDNRVILRCLHGLGDTVQFIRYAPLIRREARRLTVQAHPELIRLLKHCAGIDAAVTWGSDVPEWDQQIEITELPRIFRTVQQTIPAHVPYLKLPEGEVAASPLSRLPRQRRRAGLVWASSQWNPARSLPLPALLDALQPAGWELFSLQQGPEAVQASIAPARPVPGDVLDTAADMMNLDLVISVDTMTAHLAGALARPVWLLLPFEADWRWMLERCDSPWYPTMRLFRQRSPGDWSEPLRQLREAALDW